MSNLCTCPWHGPLPAPGTGKHLPLTWAPSCPWHGRLPALGTCARLPLECVKTQEDGTSPTHARYRAGASHKWLAPTPPADTQPNKQKDPRPHNSSRSTQTYVLRKNPHARRSRKAPGMLQKMGWKNSAPGDCKAVFGAELLSACFLKVPLLWCSWDRGWGSWRDFAPSSSGDGG